jgi:hypothetical protein
MACGPRNFSNLESFGFFLTDRAFLAAEDTRLSAAPSIPKGARSSVQNGIGSAATLQRAGALARQISSHGDAA